MIAARHEPGPWTTLCRAPLLELEVLRAALEKAGIAAIISDATLELLDPFVTGDSSLDGTLRVPSEQVASAHARIAELRTSGAEALRTAAQLDLPAHHEPTERERRMRALEVRGRRIRWAALCGVTYPFALYYAFDYLVEIHRLGQPPKGHGLTVSALVVVGLVGLVGLGWMFVQFV